MHTVHGQTGQNHYTSGHIMLGVGITNNSYSKSYTKTGGWSLVILYRLYHPYRMMMSYNKYTMSKNTQKSRKHVSSI